MEIWRSCASHPHGIPSRATTHAAVLPALRVAALLLVHGPRDRRRGHLHRGLTTRLARVVEPKFKCGSGLAHRLRDFLTRRRSSKSRRRGRAGGRGRCASTSSGATAATRPGRTVHERGRPSTACCATTRRTAVICLSPSPCLPVLAVICASACGVARAAERNPFAGGIRRSLRGSSLASSTGLTSLGTPRLAGLEPTLDRGLR